MPNNKERDNFFIARKFSNIGVMMAIDALIENGYVIMPPDKNEALKGTCFETNLDKDFHVDISAYKVDDENIEAWKNRRPRPTAIDVKYVENPPTQTGRMFFEIDNSPEQYGKRNGWGLYSYDIYKTPEAHKQIAEHKMGIRNIMFLQHDENANKKIMRASSQKEFIEIYKETKHNKMPFLIAPLHCMQWYYTDNEDKTAKDNHLSKLYRPQNSNGLLIPLSDYGKRYPYIEGTWDVNTQKWNLKKMGKGDMPKNKTASEGKLLEEDKAAKSLLQWHNEQKEQLSRGSLEYSKFL